ncbi:MAG: class I SAM-dependent methyltransferase, partial [Planctomycetota bacterium]
MGLGRFLDRLRGKRRRSGAGRDVQGEVYAEDGLRSVHNHDFVRDPAFAAAYARAVHACGKDYHWRWRMHVGLWAATACARLDGDFAECGVNHGAFASAVMHFLDWDSLGKTFWLLDTWQGMDARFL